MTNTIFRLQSHKFSADKREDLEEDLDEVEEEDGGEESEDDY